MNKKKKRALLLLGAVGVGAALLAASSRSAKAAPDEEDDNIDPPEDDEPADVDADEVPIRSPGIPQPPSVVIPPPQAIPVPNVPGGIDLDDIDLEDIAPIPISVPAPAPAPVPVQPPPVFTTQPVPVPVPPPVRPPLPVPVPVPAPAPVPVAALAPDTAEMLAVLLGAEKGPGWKRKEPSVGRWQRARGLTPDEKFGPGSALKLALEASTIPIVRFWPAAAGARPDLALDDYRSALDLIASKALPGRAENLRVSAAREQGQSFGPPQGNSGKLPIAQTFAQGAP